MQVPGRQAYSSLVHSAIPSFCGQGVSCRAGLAASPKASDAPHSGRNTASGWRIKPRMYDWVTCARRMRFRARRSIRRFDGRVALHEHWPRSRQCEVDLRLKPTRPQGRSIVMTTCAGTSFPAGRKPYDFQPRRDNRNPLPCGRLVIKPVWDQRESCASGDGR